MSDVLVLCYHAVSSSWDAPLSVTPDALDSQLSMLVRSGWRGATFREAVRRAPSKRTLVVTFDDAFASVLKLAHPILAALHLPGTVFVPTAFASTHQTLRWSGIEHWTRTPHAAELECMNWDDLRTLAADGWEIGSHTRTHPRLTELSDEDLRFELVESRRECSDQLGEACETLAYPYGDVDARVSRSATAAGYIAGAGLSSSLRKLDDARWPRIGVYHTDDARRFRLKVNRGMRLLRASRFWPAHE
jgi:peptidoglycan/xylan/chitin deacetylase (PgdA/CDA1 family)